MLPRLALASSLVGVLASSVLAQTLDWKRETPASMPTARSFHAIAYDTARRQTVMFGGFSAAGYLNDTWVWSGATWTNPTNSGPTPRLGHAMAYDAARRQVVLFGGASSSSLLRDTWVWDGVKWTNASNTGPAPRRDHAMAYDAARGQVVLFGGSDSATTLNDTWVWNGARWTGRTSARPPSPRIGHAMAYDAVRSRAVLFGGFSGSALLNGTWLWDGATWTNPSNVGPTGRYYHAMGYDAVGRHVVLSGGFDRATPHLSDTWLWQGQSWIRETPNTPAPRRSAHALAFDSARQRTLLFGGVDRLATYRDTWTYGAVGFTAYGSGCGSPTVTLSPRSDPKVGKSLVLESWNLSSTARPQAALALGIKRLNVDLTPIGMPSCWLLQSSDVLLAFTVNNGTGSYTLTIPNTQQLIGQKLLAQAVIGDPSANRLGLLTTNGAEVQILK